MLPVDHMYKSTQMSPGVQGSQAGPVFIMSTGKLSFDDSCDLDGAPEES